MSGPPWFYYPFDDIDTATLELSGEEVTHIIGARRLRVGDELVLMNGRGKMAHCALEKADKKARRLSLRVSLIAEVQPAKSEFILASALPKGDRLPTMLDMACQLGMTQFQPLSFEYSVSKWNENLERRCERILIEASKQSKTAIIPRVNPICNFAKFIADQEHISDLMLLADQYGRPPAYYSSLIESANTACILIGPEGGLSPQEVALAQQQQLARLKLASAVLRIETAAVAAVAVLQSASQHNLQDN